MSPELISRRDDLQRLVEEGYELEVRSGHLVLHRVPYVTSERTVKYGQLVCPITETGPPPDHTMYFAGEYPCDDAGAPIEALRNSSNRQELAEGLWVDHYFSARPVAGTYEHYHHKMTHLRAGDRTVRKAYRSRSRLARGATGVGGRPERPFRVHGDCVEPRRDNPTERKTVR